MPLISKQHRLSVLQTGCFPYSKATSYKSYMSVLEYRPSGSFPCCVQFTSAVRHVTANSLLNFHGAVCCIWTDNASFGEVLCLIKSKTNENISLIKWKHYAPASVFERQTTSTKKLLYPN